ncbi:MAG: transglutaminase family protein [Flavobacteriales bacterium]|nr:transglutaminase family protein [Flavobacteriales bacterium]
MLEKDLKALISLLDDPDTLIYNEVKNKLISFGDDVIPHLENAWETSLNQLLQERIEDIIHYLQFTSIKKGLIEWKNKPNHNLIEGAILIAKYQYPDLIEADIHSFINKLTQETWLEVNDNLTALEKIKVLNKIIFEIHQFSGNTKNINSPQNSYINNVIETKKGNPITLGIIYLSICEKLKIPVYGINIPAHFILAYSESKNNVLFYINVFNKGSIFFKSEIDLFLEKIETEPKKEYYIPTDSINIIKKLIQHLVYTYDSLGYVDKKNELIELNTILSE